MPISALSPDTIRILGSSQALTTPVSLIKELIDNGLDARATAIDVSISANTLDKIEVRDNGQGIDASDFDTLGKRGHTSKLRAFEELRHLGGVSLGFRGEALGSAVELGDVTITTRTEGDSVATLLKLKAPDGVYNQTKTSHPVGTTVSVQSFLSRLPVRKQTVLKETAKTLTATKELLKTYALARPHVKLSFKVLKSGKINWSFAPRPHDGIKEVVSQVINRDLASQCIEITQSSFRSLLDEDAPGSQDTVATMVNPDKVFEVHAFLPKPDADITKISKGAFVSVDARPVSCKRGTLKKIIGIYKEHIRSSLSSISSDKLKDPFIRLNIVCPSGSYDPNVEPAKDDVLFENESILLSLARSLFEHVYGDIKANMATGKKVASKAQSGFDLLMARKPVVLAAEKEVVSNSFANLLDESAAHPVSDISSQLAASSIPQSVHSPHHELSDGHQNTSERVSSAAESDMSGKRKWGFSMSKDYGEPETRAPVPNTSNLQPPPTPIDDDIEPESTSARASRASLNSWTTAKLNAPVRKRVVDNRAENVVEQDFEQSANLPTPRQSSEPPASRSVNVAPAVDSDHRPRISDHSGLRNSVATWVERHGQQTQARQCRSHSLPPEDYRNDAHPQTTVTQHRKRARNDFVVARDVPLGDPWTPPPTQPAARRERRSGFNTSFRPPKRMGEFTAINQEEFQPSVSSTPQSAYTANVGRPLRDEVPIPRQAQAIPSPENTPHEDLQYSLDYEKRKEEANRKQRLEVRETAPRPSPHQNRYNAAVAVLDAVSNTVVSSKEKDKVPFKTSLPDGDPRAYLMRRQKSMSIIENNPAAGVKLKRAKTMMLPLESTPEKFQLHNVEGTISTELYTICQAVVEVIPEDKYLKYGTLETAFDMEEEEVEGVRGWLVRESVERGWVAEGQNVKFDLSGLKKKG